MFGWFSKRSRAVKVPVEDLPAIEPVMREIPSRPTAPPGAPHPSPPTPRRVPPPPTDENQAAHDAATGPLVSWLGHANVETRVAAARELGRRGNPAAVEPLTGALRDVHAPMRIAVAHALGKLRDERAIDALADALSADEDDAVRAAARTALEAIGTARADEILAEYDRRNAAAPAPTPPPADAELAPPAPPPPLPDPVETRVNEGIAALRSEDAAAQARAADGLVQVGGGAVEQVVALLADGNVWVRQRAADVLARLADSRAARALESALSAISPEDRSYETYHLRRSLERALAASSPQPAAEPSPPAVSQPDDDAPATLQPLDEAALAPPPALAPAPTVASDAAADDQLGARLLAIAQSVFGGAEPPLDSYDGRRADARAVGETLHARGGADLMLRVLDQHVGHHVGRHAISQFWDGIGDWRG